MLTETKGAYELVALPGAVGFAPELTRSLQEAWSLRPADYRPRARHRTAEGAPRYVNRLFLESSPYLKQHAHNPVDWFPWGDEAFRVAEELGRPVLLSVGYSTCHWCHVMEVESFEDEAIARQLNEGYVAIKVDREERPDVDSVYMSALQAMTGRGGWPMTVWLTPDRRPFYAGTYYPPRDGARGPVVGFSTLLTKLRELYDAQPERIEEGAAQVTQLIQVPRPRPTGEPRRPDASLLANAQAFYRSGFDAADGGLKGAPKFPSSLPVRFLLREHRRTHDAQVLQMATLTLERMASGGIHDALGGGFHRYSTDRRWLVPHFEKMLYDNALLAIAYLEASQAARRPDFARVARETLEYLQREMASPEGGFYSAADADSLAPGGELEEGWSYTWTPQELESVLGHARARIAGAWYGVTAAGNVETGRSVLSTSRAEADVARELGVVVEELSDALVSIRRDLYAARQRRPAPSRDEKIVTAWNGLAISAFARASLVLGEPGLSAPARRAADFVLGALRRDGRLLRSYKDGAARHAGYLEDHAFLIAGLLDLLEATGEARWLCEAIALDGLLEEHFEDARSGGFYRTSDEHERLLVREKPGADGAEPSGNSVHALNLLRLSELTGEASYLRRAERTLECFAPELEESPESLSEMLLAVDFALDSPKQIALLTCDGRGEAGALLEKIQGSFLPNRVLIVATQGEEAAELAKLVPWLSGKTARDARPTAYVCEAGACAPPTTDPDELAAQLSRPHASGN